MLSRQPIMETMEKFVVQAAILIATHNVIPFDLTIVDICDGQRLFSFLCIEWGIIADVDCDSEQYRFLGEARFTVEAVKRILRKLIRFLNHYQYYYVF
jgi:sphingosine kinase